MRSHWSRVFTSVVVASLMSASLAAQTLSVPDTLTEGSIAPVIYSDASRAGQTIIITVSDGKLFPTTEQITVTLNENGVGAVGWTVPSWNKVVFTGPSGGPVERNVQ